MNAVLSNSSVGRLVSVSSTFSESHKKWVPEFLFGDVIDISRLKYSMLS